MSSTIKQRITEKINESELWINIIDTDKASNSCEKIVDDISIDFGSWLIIYLTHARGSKLNIRNLYKIYKKEKKL